MDEPTNELDGLVGERLRAPFDRALADATRLRIQAALHGLPTGGSIRFTALARTLGLSDGNLGAHLSVLIEVGYVRTEVTSRGKRQTKWYAASGAGRDAFEAHVASLRAVIDAAEQGEPR